MKKAGFLTTMLFGCSILNAQQLPNNSYENWDILTDSSPHDDMASSWNTINSSLDPFTASALNQTCFQSTDAHTGTYSIQLVTQPPPFGSTVVNGIATTGSINTSTYEVEGGLPYTMRPDSMAGWYKCNPQTGDFPTIEFVLKGSAGDTIGWARFEGSTTPVTSWTRFSVPVVYSSGATPAEAVSLLSASDGFNAVAGSELWVDDMEIIFSTGLADEIENEIAVFYNEGSIKWTTEEKITGVSIRDLNGKLVKKMDNVSTTSIQQSLNQGVYLVTFVSDNGSKTEKLSVR